MHFVHPPSFPSYDSHVHPLLSSLFFFEGDLSGLLRWLAFFCKETGCLRRSHRSLFFSSSAIKSFCAAPQFSFLSARSDRRVLAGFFSVPEKLDLPSLKSRRVFCRLDGSYEGCGLCVSPAPPYHRIQIPLKTAVVSDHRQGLSCIQLPGFSPWCRNDSGLFLEIVGETSPLKYIRSPSH